MLHEQKLHITGRWKPRRETAAGFLFVFIADSLFNTVISILAAP
jgi:hypothetical protein